MAENTPFIELSPEVKYDPATGAFLLPDDTPTTIGIDRIAMYQSALHGLVFDPSTINTLYPTTRAQRRKDMPTVEMAYSQARDIFNVLEVLGGRMGTAQLPNEPIRSLFPQSVMHSIVHHWKTEITTGLIPSRYKHIVNNPSLDSELGQLAYFLLDEAHPEQQDLLNPRRRVLDSNIETPLLILSIARIRDREDQTDAIKQAGTTDLDFKIARSAVGAYVTLISQNGLKPDVQGFHELYRRGLLPLSIMLTDSKVLNAMEALTGRTKEQLTESIARVDATHAQHRLDSLLSLLDTYEKFIEQRAQRKIELGRQIPTPVTPIKIERKVSRTKSYDYKPPAPNRSRGRPTFNAEKLARKIDEAEDKLLNVTTATALIIHEASRFANGLEEFRAKAIGTESSSVVPVIPHPSEVKGDEPLDIGLDISNGWFIAVYLSQLQLGKPIETLDKKISNPKSTPQPNSDLATFIKLITAPCGDVVGDGLVAHIMANHILDHAERGAEFVTATDAFVTMTQRLEALVLNSIQSVRNPAALKRGVGDTSVSWDKIARLAIARCDESEPGKFVELSEQEQKIASMVYQLPLRIMAPLFAGTVAGMNWGTTREVFEADISDLSDLDPTGRIMRMAQNIRATNGTAGKDIRANGGQFIVRFSGKTHSRTLRPFAERYDDLFVDEGPKLACSPRGALIGRDFYK